MVKTEEIGALLQVVPLLVAPKCSGQSVCRTRSDKTQSVSVEKMLMQLRPFSKLTYSFIHRRRRTSRLGSLSRDKNLYLK